MLGDFDEHRPGREFSELRNIVWDGVYFVLRHQLREQTVKLRPPGL
jgi:hypothetical protein